VDEFDAITAELQAESRQEQVEQAREILAAGDAERSFVDAVRRIRPGEVLTVATVDGWVARARVVRVGADWLRLAEVSDEMGTARARTRRLHEVRLSAVVRISRESGR